MNRNTKDTLTMIFMGVVSIYITIYVAEKFLGDSSEKNTEVSTPQVQNGEKLESMLGQIETTKQEIQDMRGEFKQYMESANKEKKKSVTDQKQEVTLKNDTELKIQPDILTRASAVSPPPVNVQILEAVTEANKYLNDGNYIENKHFNLSKRLNKLYDIKGLSSEFNKLLLGSIVELNQLLVDYAISTGDLKMRLNYLTVALNEKRLTESQESLIKKYMKSKIDR